MSNTPTKKATTKEAPAAKAETKKAPGLSAEQLARLKEQSGVQAGGTRLPVLNRIALNGNADAVEVEGTDTMKRPAISYRKMIMVGKDSDKRPEMEDLGAPIEVTFVKIRRRLIARDSQGFQVMSSSQHGHPTHTVVIWSDNKMIAKGPAREMREQFEDLRTVQEIYILLPDGELAMLIVKGASLGSKTRDAKLDSFYDYLQKLDKEGGIFMRKTILGGVLEKGAKDFYTSTFEMGRPCTDEELASVLDQSDELSETIAKYDEEQASIVFTEGEDDGAEEEAETVPFKSEGDDEGGEKVDGEKAF